LFIIYSFKLQENTILITTRKTNSKTKSVADHVLYII